VIAPDAQRPHVLADFLSLTKPRITGMVACTAAGGLALAPRTPTAMSAALTLLGTLFTAGAANALNCYVEREIDRRMARTRSRPLPSGRLDPQAALGFAVALGVLGLVALLVGGGPLAASLGALALVSYVFVYTPLKQTSSWSTVVGAVPGALPPLIGWTAATGSIDLPGLALFGVIFVWQLPHFFALAILCKADYANAGLKVLPNTQSELMTRRVIVETTAALVPMTALLYTLGVAGRAYLATALALGCAFMVASVFGLRPQAGTRWARAVFASSVVYLAALFAVLIIDRTA
jgi:heme o synthase